MASIAINGLGRIGRAALKIIFDTPGLNLVAAMTWLRRRISFTCCGTIRFMAADKTVESRDGALIIGGQKLRLLNEKDPTRLPWKDLKVDVVLECTERFTRREEEEGVKKFNQAFDNLIKAVKTKSQRAEKVFANA